jgi:hypothetical protein
MTAAPRPPAQRRADTLARLSVDVDVWVATARGDVPHLIPLSFLWDGARLLLATPDNSVSARNLRATGRARLTLGTTRDVVVIDGTAESLPLAAVPPATADAFAARTGFDPRRSAARMEFIWIRPTRIQAWRAVNELPGRDLMRDGTWLA